MDQLSRSIFDGDRGREVFTALEQRSSEKLRLPLSKIVVLEPTDRLSDGGRRSALIVVSFEELEALHANESLAILDGIVARLVVMPPEPKRIQHLVDDHAEHLDGLRPWEQDEAIQDLVIHAGVQAETVNDPLARARWEKLTEGTATP